MGRLVKACAVVAVATSLGLGLTGCSATEKTVAYTTSSVTLAPGEALVAVSYTHLTLPTIYSV